MQPLIGGIVRVCCLRTALRDDLSATSHAGNSTRTPFSFISALKSKAPSLSVPERDNKSRFFTPRLAIQRDMLKPIPPRPPAIRYVARGSNTKLGLVRRIVLISDILARSNDTRMVVKSYRDLLLLVHLHY